MISQIAILLKFRYSSFSSVFQEESSKISQVLLLLFNVVVVICLRKDRIELHRFF